MPQINFNPLGTQGPQGFFEGYTQGQKMQEDQLRLDQLRQDRDELMQLRAQLKAAGQNDDPTEFFKTLIKSGNPDYISKGYEGLQRYKELQRAEQLLGAEFGAPPSAKPTNALAPQAAPTGGLSGMTFGTTVGPAAPGVQVSPEDKAYQQAADQWMMGGMQGPAPTRAGAAPTNALAPAPGAEAAPANAMAAAPDRVQELRRKIAAYASVNDPRLKALVPVYQAELNELVKPQVVAPGATLTVGNRPIFTAPAAPSTLARLQTELAALPPGDPRRAQYEALIKKETTHAPVQPVAPTITQIQDPNNPAQMITVDARRYQGGGLGSPGVIGSSGKTPKAEADKLKQEQGASQAQDILDTLKTAYDELDRMQAVPSEQRGALANAMAYVAGTATGQIAGRVAGTKEQTQRDIIASARNQMLNAIKNATGMSAQQLNSNVEFRSWLEALTDPTRSIEANRSILENMEKFIASGGKYSAKKGAAAPPATDASPTGGTTGGWSVVR